ncbi:hypothetical protein LSTR_LSTR008234 [Laodelphax striatellus]|uniref:Fatty acyl-CoA reductase n=1 Tax=Laodelphax striatellus TaxID=195883 RepID=A0A482WVG5_LAOST|nr:hypothetical protein LSTR_LSTR008234 [Laodelphax striatellus]
MDYYEARDSTFDNYLPDTNEKSQIEDFFNGCTVLVTGVTGFIGNLVVEKLLRCCPGIKKIYFFIRIKKNVPERERALEVISESIFANVKEQNPTFVDKIVVVPSDCSLPNLGLSESDRKMVLDTDIVFHIAATLRFDDHFRNSMTGIGTTYSVMKSIAENVVQEYHNQFPIGIVRPSIVISTGSEPIESWIKGLNGPTAMFLGVLMGVMRVVHIDQQKRPDLIPADKVASAIVAATWDLTHHKPTSPQMPVYNVVSYNKSPISWHGLSTFYMRTDQNHPNLASERSIWEPFGIFTKSRLIYNVLYLFLHILPGIIMDVLLQFKGHSPLLMKLYRKAYYLMDVMSIYYSRVWEFEDDNLYAIWDKMTEQDKLKFNFSLVDFDWCQYYYNYARGLKVYLLKETTDFEAMEKSYRKRRM